MTAQIVREHRCSAWKTESIKCGSTSKLSSVLKTALTVVEDKTNKNKQHLKTCFENEILNNNRALSILIISFHNCWNIHGKHIRQCFLTFLSRGTLTLLYQYLAAPLNEEIELLLYRL